VTEATGGTYLMRYNNNTLFDDMLNRFMIGPGTLKTRHGKQGSIDLRSRFGVGGKRNKIRLGDSSCGGSARV
jgi:hypothetical protein